MALFSCSSKSEEKNIRMWRGPEGKKLKAEYQRKKRQAERENLGISEDKKHKRDATKVARLSENQLSNLYQQLEIVQVDDHGYGPGFEDFACHYSEIAFVEKKGALNGYGALRPVIILRSQFTPSDDDNVDLLRAEAFTPGSVVLAWHGIFPADPLDQVSHLCDNPRCLRQSHLCYESPADNGLRKNCPGLAQCRCCDEMHDVCQHTPACKKITRR